MTLPARNEEAPTGVNRRRHVMEEPRTCPDETEGIVARGAAGGKWTKAQRSVAWWLLNRLRRGRQGQTWACAAQESIGVALGLTGRTVRSSLARLEAAGLLSRKAQPVPAGGRKPDLLMVDRPALTRLVGSRFGGQKFPVRNRAKFPVRSFTQEELPTVVQISTPDGVDGACRNEATMQGKLFAGGGKKPQAPKDNAKTRLDLYRERYRAKYGRAPFVPNLGIALALVKRWSEVVPSASAWAVLMDAYLAQDDRQVVDARHPLTWLSRRLPALLPAVEREVERQSKVAKIAAENAAQDARLATSALKLKHPGIRDGETVEAWRARIAEARRAAREKEQARRWA